MQFKISSLNVKGLNSPTKQNMVWTQQLNDVLTSIKHLEHSHKQNPQPHTLEQLTQVRFDLRKILFSEHHKQMKSWKENVYFHGNKAGKLLARQLKDK